MTARPSQPPAQVAAAFAAYPPVIRKKALELRALILRKARRTDGVGPIEETLKWGEPAYLTTVSGSGSTIRIGWSAKSPERLALHFICHTRLVDSFREWFSQKLTFDGDRSIVFGANDVLPVEPLEFCIEAALTYHARKRGGRR